MNMKNYARSLQKTVKSSLVDKRVRVAFYMRVSTAEQVLEGYSPEFQLQQLAEQVKRKEYKGWYTDPKWHFFDMGSGGKIEGRPKLKVLMDLVKKGEIDLVLVWKIDRLSRNLSDLLELFETMDRNNVGFASMKEDLDFTGAIGKLIFQIFGALAEFERENIRMRTEEGRKASARAGNYTGGSIPFGFLDVPNPEKGKKLHLIPSEGKIVRQIFEWFVFEDKSARWISQELNKVGVPKGKANRRAKDTKWHEYTVRSMLGYEEYRGVFITNRFKKISSTPRKYEELPKDEWIITRIPPVIDDMLYYMAQEKLRRTAAKPGKGGGKEQYLLRGKLAEVPSGRGFVGYLSSKNTKNYRRKQYKAEGVYHPSMSVAGKPLEEFVWKHIETAIDDPEGFLKLHNETRTRQEREEELSQQLRTYEDALTTVNEKIERVKNDFYEGKIDEPERDNWLAKYEDQREGAFKSKEKAEQELARLASYNVACDHLREFSAKFEKGLKGFTFEQKRKIVDMIVERVEISEGEPREANVLLRFDPKEIASRIPGIEPSLLKSKPKRGDLVSVYKDTGASDGG
ncbi:MAG: recombinase family protein [Candidatus Peregrinibacteria bacterium]